MKLYVYLNYGGDCEQASSTAHRDGKPVSLRRLEERRFRSTRLGLRTGRRGALPNGARAPEQEHATPEE